MVGDRGDLGEPGSSAMLWRGEGKEVAARSRDERGVEEGSRIRMLATDVRGILRALVVIGAIDAGADPTANGEARGGARVGISGMATGRVSELWWSI